MVFRRFQGVWKCDTGLKWVNDNVVLLGDFNVELEEKDITNILNNHHLKYFSNKQTNYLKKPEKPLCIDAILFFIYYAFEMLVY